VADSQSNVFFTDYWNAVDELPSGSTSFVTIATAGGTHYGIALDGQGNVYYTDNLGGTVREIPVSTSSASIPQFGIPAVMVAALGMVLVAFYFRRDNQRRKVA
jgi:streptogramin lyase